MIDVPDVKDILDTTSLEDHGKMLVLFFFGVLVSLLDVYTSHLGLERGFVEGNPVMNEILVLWGVAGFVVLNLTVSVLLLLLLFWGSVKNLHGYHQYIPLIVYCVLRTAAVTNNLLLII